MTTRFPVPDPNDPTFHHIITGSQEGILALQALLKHRFQDGRAVGKAEVEEPVAFIPPEARGETPLDGLELAG